MKKAVAIILFLVLVTCAFSGCVEEGFLISKDVIQDIIGR